MVLTHWGQDKMAANCRRHFQTHFLEWKLLYFDSDFTEIYFQGSNLKYASIGSKKGLVLIRQQAIIWTNDSLVY